jgi:hypothetical protein
MAISPARCGKLLVTAIDPMVYQRAVILLLPVNGLACLALSCGNLGGGRGVREGGGWEGGGGREGTGCKRCVCVCVCVKCVCVCVRVSVCQ